MFRVCRFLLFSVQNWICPIDSNVDSLFLLVCLVFLLRNVLCWWKIGNLYYQWKLRIVYHLKCSQVPFRRRQMKFSLNLKWDSQLLISTLVYCMGGHRLQVQQWNSKFIWLFHHHLWASSTRVECCWIMQWYPFCRLLRTYSPFYRSATSNLLRAPLI